MNNKRNIWIVGIILLWGSLIYSNSLDNQFLLLDDAQSIVGNQNLKNFFSSLLTLRLQTIVNSGLINFFGPNPIAFHGFSVGLHLLNTVLVFALVKELFNNKTALLACAFFVSHPVNTEAVSWISGNTYLLKSSLFLGYFLLYLYYSKWCWQENKLIGYGPVVYLVFYYALIALLVRDYWVVVIPAALPVLDWIKGYKVWDKSKLWLWGGFLFVIGYFLLISGSGIYQRWSNKAEQAYTALNQQTLIPVWESWAFSIFSMVKLYVWPVDLMVYYDANPVSSLAYYSMYVIYLGYIMLFVWFLMKGKRNWGGMMLMLTVLIIPVLNPWGLSWYMAERYLYIGSVFWSALAACGLIALENRLGMKNLAVYLGLVLVLAYSVRTYIRNEDWQNSKTLAMATLRTSPLSIRAYSDLGNYYLIQRNPSDARISFESALKIYPEYSVAMQGLGSIYLNEGLEPENVDKAIDWRIDLSEDELLFRANKELNSGHPEMSIFYFSCLLNRQIDYVVAVEGMGKSYFIAESWDFAKLWFGDWMRLESDNPEVYYWLARTALEMNNIDLAKSYVDNALLFEPENNIYQQLSAEIEAS